MQGQGHSRTLDIAAQRFEASASVILLIERGLVFDAKYPGSDEPVIGLNEFYIYKS